MRLPVSGRRGKGVWGLIFLSPFILSGCDEGFFVETGDRSTTTVVELRIVTGEGEGSLGMPAGAQEAHPSLQETTESGTGDAALVTEGAGASLLSGPPALSGERAFQRVDRVAVLLVGGGDVLVDEVIQASEENGEIRLRFSFDLQAGSLDADLEVALRTPEATLFEGEGQVLLQRGRTARAQLSLVPIPAGIVLPSDAGPFEALGDTVTLGGAVRFATGDTITGLALEWESLTPDVVTVSPAGTAVAIAEGEAELRASFEEFAELLTLRVAPVVTEVQVRPSEVQIEPGESVQLTAEARDRRGNPLERRQVAWRSSDPSVAQVGSGGRVHGLRPGSVQILAEVEEVEGVAQLTVVAVPPVVETLPVEGIEADRARLVARVNPRALPSELVFRWGTDPQLSEAAVTSPIQVPAGTEFRRFELMLEGLDPETTYYVRAEATSEGGRGTGTTREFTTPSLLPAPEEFSARVILSGVLLEWSYPFPQVGNVEFQVEREVVDGPDGSEPESWTRIGTTDATRFIDSQAPPNSSVSYRVRACQGGACSPYSVPATVATPDPQPASIQGRVTLNAVPVQSMLIRLSGPDGTRTTTTASDGSYSFLIEEPGEYVVEIVPSSVGHPNGWYSDRVREVQISEVGEVVEVDFRGFTTSIGLPGSEAFSTR